jgi:nucleoside-diphosphate-sugar epimerase
MSTILRMPASTDEDLFRRRTGQYRHRRDITIAEFARGRGDRRIYRRDRLRHLAPDGTPRKLLDVNGWQLGWRARTSLEDGIRSYQAFLSETK